MNTSIGCLFGGFPFNIVYKDQNINLYMKLVLENELLIFLFCDCLQRFVDCISSFAAGEHDYITMPRISVEYIFPSVMVHVNVIINVSSLTDPHECYY